LSREYWTEVFQPTLEGFEKGLTPNPDIACNREIKFGKLHEKLESRHSDGNWWLATGHYARSATDPETGKSVLLRPVDRNKDQTFFLSTITQQSLRRTLFPLSHYTKPQVREFAKTLLPSFINEKPESMGLCFVEPTAGPHFSTFLKDFLPLPSPVPLYLENGEQVGMAPSIWHITIGEKSRLDFRKSQQLNPGGRWYVARKTESPAGFVIVPGRDHPSLYGRWLVVSKWKWIDEDEKWEGRPLTAQIRHRQKPIECVLQRMENTKVKLIFTNEKGVYGVPPGQTIAVYDGERVLGGGRIEDVYCDTRTS
jgi:tRNA-5-taurinomethyluridine 2-sulfurtransferase